METRTLAMVIASNIEAEMSKQGLDRAKLGRLVGSNPTVVYDILSGKVKSPKVDTLEKIAGALGISVISLLREPSENDIDKELTQVFDLLPQGERKRLLLMAQALVSQEDTRH